jgi:hypothetical protein
VYEETGSLQAVVDYIVSETERGLTIDGLNPSMTEGRPGSTG